jgi:hypothetical protein
MWPEGGKTICKCSPNIWFHILTFQTLQKGFLEALVSLGNIRGLLVNRASGGPIRSLIKCLNNLDMTLENQIRIKIQ